MTLEEARAVFAANVGARDGSFFDVLHEGGRFARDRFWELYNAAVILGASEEPLGQALREDALHLYEQALTAFLWHHSPHDSSHIADLPAANLADYVERLRFAFTTLIRGRSAYGPDATNDLVNPRLAELDAYFGRG